MSQSNNLADLLTRAKTIFLDGGTLLYPTDTIIGLGCDATREDAVTKIFDIKQRPANKSLVVLVPNEVMLEAFVPAVPETAWQLIETAEKPITVVFAGARGLAPSVVAEDGSVGIRIVRSGFAHDLMTRTRKPLVSTSANISGEPPAIEYADVDARIKNAVDLGVDLPTGGSAPSTIVKFFSDGTFKILRK